MEKPNTGYEQALKKVIDIRLQRQKIYGDDWRDSEYWELMAFIKSKAQRLKHLVIDNKSQSYEKIEDTLVDLINYSLFMLELKIEKQQ